MRHLTIRKHGRKAPTDENTPERSESEKRASTSKKSARADDSAHNKASKTKRVSQHVEGEEDEISEPEQIKNISHETYTLHKSVVLGDIIIVSDTDFLKHDEFHYRDFETHNIRKLDDAAKKGGFGFTFVSGTATIAAKGVRVCDSIVIALEDSSGWKKVERGIERYMVSNKKEIIVKLAIVYSKTGEADSESSEDERHTHKKVIALFCC
jgi:hypothetical protein